MTTILDQAKDTLLLGGLDLTETRELPHGWQLRCAGGEIVNVYSTGSVVAQGRNAPTVKMLFQRRPLSKATAPAFVKPEATVAKQVINPDPDAAPEEFRSRLPPGWSDVWSPADVPF